MERWPCEEPSEELPLEASTAFLSGATHQGYLHGPGAKVAGSGDGPWAAGGSPQSPGIPAAFYHQPKVFETFGQLSLADSPVKRAPAAAAHVAAGPPAAAPRAAELEAANAALVQRVRELEVGAAGVMAGWMLWACQRCILCWALSPLAPSGSQRLPPSPTAPAGAGAAGGQEYSCSAHAALSIQPRPRAAAAGAAARAGGAAARGGGCPGGVRARAWRRAGGRCCPGSGAGQGRGAPR